MSNPLHGRTGGGGKAQAGCLVSFGLIFSLAGGFLLWIFVLSPLIQAAKSRDWPALSCTIVESRLVESYGSDSKMYHPLIRFRYTVNGTDYESDRIDFGSSGMSSSKSIEAATLEPYPVGKVTACYVNPEDPAQAVLSRSFAHGMARWIVVPLGAGFGAIGLGIVLVGLFTLRTKRASAQQSGGRVVLKPGMQRVKKAVLLVFLNLFWNGITSVFIVVWLGGRIAGTAEGFWMKWGFGLFLLPFAAVGVAMLGALFKQVATLFAPRVSLVLDSATWKTGTAVQIQRQVPSQAVLTALTLRFECEESAVYRRGTDTAVDREVVASYTILHESGRRIQGEGTVQFEVPCGLMPSFESINNKIRWNLRVLSEGEGPNTDDEYTIVLEEGAPDGC